MFHYYATQQAPNGTHDLLICDADGQVIGLVSDALFGVPDRKFGPLLHGESIITDGDSVFCTKETDLPDEDRVAHLDADELERFIATSPVQTADDVRTAIHEAEARAS